MSVQARISTSFLLGVAAGVAVMWVHRRYTTGG